MKMLRGKLETWRSTYRFHKLVDIRERRGAEADRVRAVETRGIKFDIS